MLTPNCPQVSEELLKTIPTWPSKKLFHNLLFRMQRGSTISILNQKNKACNGTDEIGQNCHFVTLRNCQKFSFRYVSGDDFWRAAKTGGRSTPVNFLQAVHTGVRSTVPKHSKCDCAA